MQPRMVAIIVLILLIPLLLIIVPASVNMVKRSTGISIVEAKMALAVDDKLMPVQPAGTFSKDTSKVTCWFRWSNAQVGATITAKWYFMTEDTLVFDYDFVIPRKVGYGSVSLAMPEGRTLPVGQYRVDLKLDKRTLKSILFTVE